MREILERGLEALGLGTESAPALAAYAGLVLERNQVMNLTAITEPGAFAALHLLDSLALIPLAELEAGSAVDVGTGAGFPGVPLAIALPPLHVTLLDSLGKRVDFLRESCGALGLKNTACIHARAEEFAGERRESFDFAVSRAVAELPVLCELCLPLVKVGGRFLAMKSSHCDGEMGRAERAIALLGGRTGWVRDYTVPTTEVVHRVVCVFMVSPPPPIYLGWFDNNKKRPLGT